MLDNVRAKQRVDAIVAALHRYEPDLTAIKGIGFCVSIKHAEFMADTITNLGIPAAAFVSGVKEAGEIIGIKLLDHIIIGDSYLSFVSQGLL